MKQHIEQPYTRTCYEFVCWSCLGTWISNTFSGHGARCPFCNGCNLDLRPMNKNDFKEI